MEKQEDSELKEKTSKKKFKQKVKEFKQWIKVNRTKPLKEIMETIKLKLIGHYNYYGITDNIYSLTKYKMVICRNLYLWLNRRSQKKSYNSISFNKMLERYKLPSPKIMVNIYDI